MKYSFIAHHTRHYSVSMLCRVLSVSRSGYYQWLTRKPSKRQASNDELLIKINDIYQQHKGRYGSPRIYKQLKREGECTSLGRVERIMHKNNIVAKRSKRHKRVYIQRQQQKAAENILDRCFTTNQPNTKWVSDITFIATKEGSCIWLWFWIYIHALL